jgi:hypothetical protein
MSLGDGLGEGLGVRLRAPRQHGGVLAVPPLDESAELLEINRRRFGAAAFPAILGRSLAELRALVAGEARTAAARYLDSLGIPVPSFESADFVVTGHQPELFHPGVWVKNFALQRLARRHRLTPLSLIVDNDNAKSTSIRVPDVAVTPARLVTAPYDRWTGPKPHEELEVHDEATFARFPEAVQAVTNAWPFQPLLPEFWQGAMQVARRTRNVGERLAGARRLFEERWDCRNLELPMSRLCDTESFAWFAAHLLGDLPRFQAIHNCCLRAFRQQRGIRSHSHPFPELLAQGEWLEAPFWIWRAGQSPRRRLFVRRTAESLELRGGNDLLARLPLFVGREWQTLAERGIKLRTRALTTTLFARLFLAALFVHGIGGGIYDVLTDQVIRQFYGLEPPAFVVLSATMYLPFSRDPENTPRPADTQQALRDLRYNPDRHLDRRAGPEALALRRQKLAWIQRAPDHPAARRERFNALHEINDRLRAHVGETRQQLVQASIRAQQTAETNKILRNREYAFCLFPEEEIRGLVNRE